MGSISNDKDPQGRIQRPSDRPLRQRRTVETDEVHVQELGALAQLMLGVAWADGSKTAVEIVAIAEQLKEFVETTSLPPHVSNLMGEFDPTTFDPVAACACLHAKSYDDRVAVLSLLARVAGADKVVHPAEDAFLRKVADALGLDGKSLQIKLG